MAARGNHLEHGTAALVLVLLVGAAAPAAAHVDVFVGGAFGFPAYPAPYYYGCVYTAPYPYVAYPGLPPPGWVPGHWEWRYDAWGRAVQVWMPAHLR